MAQLGEGEHMIVACPRSELEMSSDANAAIDTAPTEGRLLIAGFVGPQVAIISSIAAFMVLAWFTMPGGLSEAEDIYGAIASFSNLMVFSIILLIAAMPFVLVVGVVFCTPVALFAIFVLTRVTNRLDWSIKKMWLWGIYASTIVAFGMALVAMQCFYWSPGIYMFDIRSPNVFLTWLTSFGLGAAAAIPLINWITQIKSITLAASAARAERP